MTDIPIKRAWTPATCIHVWVEPDANGNLACCDCNAIRTNTGWATDTRTHWADDA